MKQQEHRENKLKASMSIKKAQGTLNKVLQMVEEDQYCPEIIQQIDAAIGLLQSSKKKLLLGHLDHCLKGNLKDNKSQTVEELVKIFDLK